MGVGEQRARGVLHRLVADTFVERTLAGARRAPVRPILNRVISMEAKRSDLVAAFTQARAHSAFADVSVVAFDLAHRHRAVVMRDAYAREGIGLLGLVADGLPLLDRPAHGVTPWISRSQSDAVSRRGRSGSPGARLGNASPRRTAAASQPGSTSG
jgi:hypothetical protein